MMRTVIYARYSSNNQSEASIEDQVHICRKRIEGEGWTLVDVYSDAALSGATTLRPGYQKLLEDARNGSFDTIVAEALDRLSRDQEDVAGLYKQLSFSGVRLVTVAEGEINELHVGLKGTMNALYLKDLALKTHRGLEGRVRQGRSGGGISYGFDVVRRLVDGELKGRGERRTAPEQAGIVRRIFREYAEGASPRRIAMQLNRDKVPGPSGKGWDASTINGNRTRGTGILNNELYIGRMVWNRLRYIKDPATGKRVSRLNPPEAWVITEIPELRIIGDELWSRVKARQEAMSKDTRPDRREPRPFWEKSRPRFLLSGLMKCGSCGAGYVKISANLFGCAAARNKGTCDNRLNIRRETLEEHVLSGLRAHLMTPDLFKVFAEEFAKEWNRLAAARNADAESIRTRLEKIDKQVTRLVEAIANGADAIALNEKLKLLEKESSALSQKVTPERDPEPLIHPRLADIYRTKIAGLTEAIERPDDRAQAFEIIRSLIERVVLTPVDGELRIDLHGELAAILSLCKDGKQKPAPQFEERAEQIKMVAGVGFEPTTFSL